MWLMIVQNQQEQRTLLELLLPLKLVELETSLKLLQRTPLKRIELGYDFELVHALMISHLCIMSCTS